jgi:hypothetical protein
MKRYYFSFLTILVALTFENKGQQLYYNEVKIGKVIC